MNDCWTAKSPGTFGELVQGKVEDRNFLITLPIDRFATATIPAALSLDQTHLSYSKTEKFLKVLGAHLGKDLTCPFDIHSELPRGKGLASSSADLTAAGTAILSRLGIDPGFHPELISLAARSVEPTDGVMHAGIVAYAHHECALIERLGSFDFEVAGVLLDEEIDTVDFDSKSLRYTAAECREFSDAYGLCRQGVAEGDLELIGAASTISARINQRFLPKPSFDQVMRLREKRHLPGLVVAHSGTAIGLLLRKDAAGSLKQDVLNELQQIYGRPAEIYSTWMHGPRLVGQPGKRAQSQLLIKGRQRVRPAPVVPDELRNQVLWDARGEFAGLAIDHEASIEQMAEAARIVRAAFRWVEIEPAVVESL